VIGSDRGSAGGTWLSSDADLQKYSYAISMANPMLQNVYVGLRLASVPSLSIPEPSTYALLLLGAGVIYFWKRRKFFSLIYGDSLAWSCAGRAGTHGVAGPRPRLLIRGGGRIVFGSPHN